MYALVDNKNNRCWAFQETKKEIEDILALQEDPTYYRIEKVKKEDYNFLRARKPTVLIVG